MEIEEEEEEDDLTVLSAGGGPVDLGGDGEPGSLDGEEFPVPPSHGPLDGGAPQDPPAASGGAPHREAPEPPPCQLAADDY